MSYGPPVEEREPRRVVLADGRWTRDVQDEPTRRALVRFGAGTALALGLLALAAALLAERAAQQEGVTDARRVTEVVAHTVIEPQLTPGLVRVDAAELDRLDSLVREHVLGHTKILRVKLWTSTGRILYSDEPRLMGQRYPLEGDELEVLRSGGVEAESSDLRGA